MLSPPDGLPLLLNFLAYSSYVFDVYVVSENNMTTDEVCSLWGWNWKKLCPH